MKPTEPEEGLHMENIATLPVLNTDTGTFITVNSESSVHEEINQVMCLRQQRRVGHHKAR